VSQISELGWVYSIRKVLTGEWSRFVHKLVGEHEKGEDIWISINGFTYLFIHSQSIRRKSLLV